MTMLSEGITIPKCAPAVPTARNTITIAAPIILPANLTIVFLHSIKNATQAAHLHGEGHLRGAYAVAKRKFLT
jgi:hypothetical protein